MMSSEEGEGVMMSSVDGECRVRHLFCERWMRRDDGAMRCLARDVSLQELVIRVPDR